MRSAKFALVALVTACASFSAPSVRVTKLLPEPLAPRPATYAIRIYRGTQPRCAFDKVALLSTDQTSDIRTTDQLDDVLRVSARESGGDAIIDLASETRTSGGEVSSAGFVTTYKTVVWSGTVIHFKDPQCAE
jgi:hypothetical protein